MLGGFVEGEQYFGGAVGPVDFIGRVLVAKPQWRPAVHARAFVLGEKTGGAMQGRINAWREVGKFVAPSEPRAEGVRGEVGAGAVEGQVGPASAKSWDAAVAILQIK